MAQPFAFHAKRHTGHHDQIQSARVVGILTACSVSGIRLPDGKPTKIKYVSFVH